MGFALDKFTDVTIRSVNIRAEMHGTEPVPAIDIGLHLEGSNNLLLGLDPPLKAMLYKPAGDDAPEPELDGIDPHTDMTELRSTALESMPLTCEFSGMALEIDYGLGGKSNIRVGDCEANQFKLETKDGGSVEIDFRVQASGLDSPVLGQIGALVRHKVRVTLIGPTVEDNDDDANPFKFSASNGQVVDNHPLEAGDIFAASVLASNDAAKVDTPAKPKAKPTPAALKASAKAALKAAAAKGAAKHP